MVTQRMKRPTLIWRLPKTPLLSLERKGAIVTRFALEHDGFLILRSEAGCRRVVARGRWRKAVRVELVFLACSDRLSSALLGLQHVHASFVPLWLALISTYYRHVRVAKDAQGLCRSSPAVWPSLDEVRFFCVAEATTPHL